MGKMYQQSETGQALTPIQTYYNGNHFRSRVETRWAYYFDLIGLKYIYEVDGFRVHDGSIYLPDFLLPDLNCFAEVKPDFFGTYQMQCCDADTIRRYGDDFKKWLCISESMPILFLIGNPHFHAMPILNNQTINTVTIYKTDRDFHLDIVNACYRGSFWNDKIRQANHKRFDHYDTGK